jgi:hypothetical protein
MAIQDLECEGKFRNCSNGSSSSNGGSVTEETSLLSSEGKPDSPFYQSTDGTEEEDSSNGDKNEAEKPMGKSVLGILSLLMLGKIT